VLAHAVDAPYTTRRPEAQRRVAMPDPEPKKNPPSPPKPEDSGGDIPRPPRTLTAALVGGAIGGFIGALAGSIVQAMGS